MELDVIDRTSVDLGFGDCQPMENTKTVFLGKIGQITLVDQSDNIAVSAVYGRDEILFVRNLGGRGMGMTCVTLRVVMVMIVVAVIVMAVSMIVRMLVLGLNVDCSRVHPKLNAGDPFARLALEMQVMVFEVDFTQLPFEYRRRHSEIGECPNKHIAANP